MKEQSLEIRLFRIRGEVLKRESAETKGGGEKSKGRGREMR